LSENEFQYCFGVAASRLLSSLAVAAASVALAACGTDTGTSGASSGLRVVATTTQAGDLVRNVTGDRAQVTQILSPNADPHEYELRPHDVQAVADADLVVRSGGDVDAWLTEAVEQSGGHAGVLTLSDSVTTISDDKGDLDPHWWQDPRNAILAVGAIEKALSAADRGGAQTYHDHAQRYVARLRALDHAVAACWRKVPAAERKLVTTHDALAYYARRYGIEVIGTVIPSLSTQGQASAGELSELIQTIRREGVRVVFAESSVNSKVEQAIADEAGAHVGRPLWADTLGPHGSDGATYLQSIASNTDAMVDGVTGGAVSCALPADS
jgi:ABC-type Zn uptake system ZnuABC Zn-binding protein ZnuA